MCLVSLPRGVSCAALLIISCEGAFRPEVSASKYGFCFSVGWAVSGENACDSDDRDDDDENGYGEGSGRNFDCRCLIAADRSSPTSGPDPWMMAGRDLNVELTCSIKRVFHSSSFVGLR